MKIAPKIVRPSLPYFPRKKQSKSVTVGSGRFIVLNDYASAKIAYELISIFFKGVCAV